MDTHSKRRLYGFAKRAALGFLKTLIRDREELARKRAYKAAELSAAALAERLMANSVKLMTPYTGVRLSGGDFALEIESFQKGLAKTLAIRGLALALGQEDPLKGCLGWDDLAIILGGCSMGSALSPARRAFGDALVRPGLGLRVWRWPTLISAARDLSDLEFSHFLEMGEACAAQAQRELILNVALPASSESPTPRGKSRSL